MKANDSFYWKPIEMAAEEVNFLVSESYKVLPDNTDFFQVIKLPVKKVLDLNVYFFGLIQVEGNSPGTIHTDYRHSHMKVGFQLALNIPLENCENSTTSFWKSDYEPPFQILDNGSPYNIFDQDRCKKITEFNLTQPTLLRIDIPHCVANPTDKIRKALSVRFIKDPWHLTK